MNQIVHVIREKVAPYGSLGFLCWTGSRVYGLNQEGSDFDFHGFFIPDFDHLVGIKKVRHVSMKWENEKGIKFDGQVYEIRELFGLLTRCSPNVLEMLWARDQDIFCRTPVSDMVCQNKELFLSKRLKHSFGGYAHAQLMRMTRFDESMITNKSRLDRVKTFGYDTKEAATLIRLLLTGYEALVEGELHVYRKDNKLLRMIIEGKYALEKVQKMASKKFELLEEAYIRSDLPHKPDPARIDCLLREIIKSNLKSYFTGMEG